MRERPLEWEQVLADVRRRWTTRASLRAWTRAASAMAVVVAASWTAALVTGADGLALLVIAGLASIAMAIVAVQMLRPWRRPSDIQLARLIEERSGGLDDVVVTAVEYAARPEASARTREALAGDAARALSSLGSLDHVIPSATVRRAALSAVAATAALAAAVTLAAPVLSRATALATAYLFPAHLSIDVMPGAVRVPAGQPLTIAARVRGAEGELVPTLVVTVGDESRTLAMTRADDGAFAVAIDRVTASFEYMVTAANVESAAFAVTVLHPPQVERIDLYYEYPKALGLAPRRDEGSGDVYGPQGTRVRLAIAADKPIRHGHLLREDGSRVALGTAGTALDGALLLSGNGSYRVALVDEDGLENPGDTEYFIRVIDDRPPNVRILRPASDRTVTPLEEVLIEAHADDDFGIAAFDLVLQAPDGAERSVPLEAGGTLTASGLHTLFLEELGVQPGDFVSYYARARDVNRGRRGVEARSDIFFLEVKPFEQEFVAAQSQSGQGSGAQGSQLQELAEAQKQIIVATWNLDARARRAGGAAAGQDVAAVGRAQATLRDRAEQVSAQAVRLSDPRRRRRADVPPPGEDPIGRAIEAMGRAVAELEKPSTQGALPHEREALNHLLRAEAENRRRQVARSQQAGGQGGQNRAEADLSTLFDQELRKRQQTNYESPNSTETREDRVEKDPLETLRELARRQDALTRQQRELARNQTQLDREELKRQLERLTREQQALRQRTQELSQQLQRGTGGGEGEGTGSGRSLQQASEDMRDAAAGMRREEVAEAAERGSRAADRLREIERQMQTARPDERRRALGDLQLETRQLAEAQRKLAGESARAAEGAASEDARRRWAGEQERLAERAERLTAQVERLAGAGQGDAAERQATAQAARELARQHLSDRMRQSAEGLRRGTPRAGDQQQMAEALERVAGHLGQASGGQDAETQRYSDQLAQTQALRDQVRSIEQTIEQLQREQAAGRQDARGPDRGQQPRAGAGAAPQPGDGALPGGGQRGDGRGGEQPSSTGREGATGAAGGIAGGGGGRLDQLQRDLNGQMREAERMAEAIRRDNPEMRGPDPEEGWWRSFSAPGTEAFKQDFSRWESLKQHLLVALDSVDTQVSDQLRAEAAKQRFNAGGHDAVSDSYRALVDKYYRSLATPRRPR